MRLHYEYEIHTHPRGHKATRKQGMRKAAKFIQLAVDRKINGIFLTDHHHLWSDDDLEAILDEAGPPNDFLLVSGQEVSTRDYGHVLVFGADKSFPKNTRMSQIFEHRANLAIVAAHPYKAKYASRINPLYVVSSKMIHGVEVRHKSYGEDEVNQALDAQARFRFSPLGSSDAHLNRHIGLETSLFPRLTCLQDVIDAIREGMCRPAN